MSIKDKFETSILYEIISRNNTERFQQLLNGKNVNINFRLLSKNAETYLHVAVQKKCHLDIMKELIPRVRIGQRDVNRKTAFEYACENEDQNSFIISKFHQDYILECIKNGTVVAIQELILDGWSNWPIKETPEIEEFPEALGYLSGNKGQLHFNDKGVALFPRHKIKEITKTSSEDILQYSKEKDILGMTPIHWAVLYKDLEALNILLKCALAEELLHTQDNMGRTPVHYAFSFVEGNVIRDKMESVVSDTDSSEIIDKQGCTANDYRSKRFKLDTKKLIHLYMFIIKCFANNYFVKSAIKNDTSDYDYQDLYGGSGGDDSHMMAKIMYNCKDQPFIDASGRNYLHKAVILCHEEECADAIFGILSIDGNHGNKLYKGRDLWGRTPLHYAYMFNTEAMHMLLKKKLFLPQEVINEVKKVKDYEGKTINDYHMEDKDAKELKRDLANTLMLLTSVGILPYVQHLIINSILDEHSDDNSATKSLDQSISGFRKQHGDAVVLLAMHSKTKTGVPLLHLLTALPDTESTLEELGGIFKPNVEDYMGRTVWHYLNKDSFKGYLENNEEWKTTKESDEKYHEVPNKRYHRFDLEFDDPNDDHVDEDEEYIGLYKKDLQGCNAFDAHEGTPSFSEQKNILSCLRDIVNKKTFTTHVKQTNTEIIVNNQRSTGNITSSKNRLPSTGKPRMSAKERNSKVIPPPPAIIDNSPPFDTEYLKRELGPTLTAGLGVISLVQPTDPIEFLAQYLYKYSENIKYKEQKKQDENQLALEMEIDRKAKDNRERLNEERKMILEQNKALEKAPQFNDQIIVEENEAQN